MKKFAIVTVALMTAASAMATVSVQWIWAEIATGGVLDSGGDPLAGGSTVELIWSADQAAGGPGDVSLYGDVLLGTGASTPNAIGGFWDFGTSSYDGNNFGLGEDGLVGGYVYQRVFDGLGFYAVSDPSQISGPLSDQDPTPAPPNQSTLYLTGTFSGPWTAVPEPGTMALLACGALVLGVRRFRRKDG